MDEKSYFVDDRVIEGHKFIVPKVIAKITICGALTIEVQEGTNWNPPTPEQIKNLKETFNIDVELIGDNNES